MTDKIFISHTISDLPGIVKQILSEASTHKIFALHGEMGTGKTTLVKAFCSELGVTDEVQSPTFALVHEYNANKEAVFHLDLYRLHSPDEALKAGLEEYITGENYCFIEWPAFLKDFFPAETMHIYIFLNENGSRTIKFFTDEQ